MDEQKDNITVPSFDEGKPKPSPIESTIDDGLRNPIPGSPAGESKSADNKGTPATATMPPEEAGNPDRNTM
jgi:hypothetical protein